uniref:Uncharacterized protein n=1 Tax=Sipha flava TaxID=143950 RepID=A0A2S2QEV1_9HEMI
MNKKTNVKNDCRSYRDAGGAVRASFERVRICFFLLSLTPFSISLVRCASVSGHEKSPCRPWARRAAADNNVKCVQRKCTRTNALRTFFVADERLCGRDGNERLRDGDREKLSGRGALTLRNFFLAAGRDYAVRRSRLSRVDQLLSRSSCVRVDPVTKWK